jgi:hypothetical protein
MLLARSMDWLKKANCRGGPPPPPLTGHLLEPIAAMPRNAKRTGSAVGMSADVLRGVGWGSCANRACPGHARTPTGTIRLLSESLLHRSAT